LVKPEISNIPSLILLGILLLLSWKSKKDPLFYILISAIIGIVIKVII
jgi:RsiW-degrading membrane proteinase PrsW (M82 family)